LAKNITTNYYNWRLVRKSLLLRKLLGTWLGQHVGNVFLAEDGEEALRILSDHKIDLILSDVRIPRMSGFELVKKINEANGHRPVILITGFSDVTLREAQDLGVQAILEKPIAHEDLLHEVRRGLTDPDELWQKPDGARGRPAKLTTSFESLDAALREKRIAFGRRGFCIELMSSLQEGPINFTLDFKADQQVISGHETVRWTAPQDRQAWRSHTSMMPADDG